MENISDKRAYDILSRIIGAGVEAPASYLQTFFKVMASAGSSWSTERAAGPLPLNLNLPSNFLPPLCSCSLSMIQLTFILQSWMRLWENIVYRPSLMKLLFRTYALSSKKSTAGRQSHPLARRTLVLRMILTTSDIFLQARLLILTIVALLRHPTRYKDPDVFQPWRFLGDNLNAYTSWKELYKVQVTLRSKSLTIPPTSSLSSNQLDLIVHTRPQLAPLVHNL